MSQEWTIYPQKHPQKHPDSDSNNPHLVGCRIRLSAEDMSFKFLPADDDQPLSTSTGNVVPTHFEPFQSKLNGHDPHWWYITVDKLDDSQEELTGYWSHTNFHHEGEDPPDTWTAQAGQGVEIGDGEEKEKGAAASTSPKL